MVADKQSMCVAGGREHAGDQHIIDRSRQGLGAAGSWCIRFSASLTGWVSQGLATPAARWKVAMLET